MGEAPLAVGGNRLRWQDLPARLKREIEAAAGAAIVVVDGRPGGFSPGLASLLRLADGRSVFVKAVHADRNPDTPTMYRREAQVLAALPLGIPTPRLLWYNDQDGWVVLMCEAILGHSPVQPWIGHELAAFLALAQRLATQLTPSPIAAPTIQDTHGSSFTGWRSLASQPAVIDRLDPWAVRHLDELVELETRSTAAATGDTLLHGDLRADNVLLTDNGAVAVDWPSACIGATWVDLLFAVPSIVMHGGGDPHRLWARYRPAHRAAPDAVDAVLAAITGYFIFHGLQPPPPNLAAVRPFQRAQGRAALTWLRQRLAR